MPTLEELETRLLRGLDADKQNVAHDAIWLDLLAEYEALVDAARQTCRREDRVGQWIAATEDEAAGLRRGRVRGQRWRVKMNCPRQPVPGSLGQHRRNLDCL